MHKRIFRLNSFADFPHFESQMTHWNLIEDL
jgi:hypothetical protein